MSTLDHRKKAGWRYNYFLKAFLLGLGLSFLVFIPFIVIDGGRFLFYGDFNVQQVPFYRIAHDAIRSGNIGWNHLTDLGVNFVGSYSFYLLGSPFFWLTIPFPSEWLQFLMGPLLILKFACAVLTGYIYLRRYVKNQNYALIGALLYAFSGFSIYNIFFNHFHEAIVFFPLMLAALDEYMYKRRRGVFALSVAACCIVNYYFFVGQVTFTLIYFFLRLLCKSWKISLRDLLLLLLEAVLGLGVSAVLLLPSIFTVLQNNRTDNLINGWNAVLYNKNQRYLHILECFFFPPDLPARPNFTPESESKWASLGAWLPLFSMTGVIGWLQIRRKHWLKKFLWILFLMAFVPFLNSAFQMMNGSYYGRWLYMLTLMMALATIMALEYKPVSWKRAVSWTLGITLSIALVIGFMPKKITSDTGEESYSFGLMQYPDRFWTYVAIALVSIAVVVFLFQFFRRGEKRFQRAVLVALSIISVLYSIYFIAIGKTQSQYTYDHIIPYALNGGRDVDLPDLYDDALRTDFYESLDNSAMFWQVPSIQAFHSIVPGSIMDFYKTIGVQRDVASRPDTTHYALRGLTSVKWLFDDDHNDTTFTDENGDPKMPGWLYNSNANGFDIWENEYYVPMGFCYDYYITENDFTAASESQRELMMMRGVILNTEQAERLDGVLTQLPDNHRSFTQETYLQDCLDRAARTCTTFQYTNTGFNAEISINRESFVFFSVPYESGWSATVNGEAAPIEQVNVGFMAVTVPAGEKVIIEFKYRTPGLVAGALVTGASIIVLVTYLYFIKRNKPRAKSKKLPESSLLNPRPFAEYAEKHGASFQRKGAMVPKEFIVPYPPEGFVESGTDEPEDDTLYVENPQEEKLPEQPPGPKSEQFEQFGQYNPPKENETE